jgi:hypothetical protein
MGGVGNASVRAEDKSEFMFDHIHIPTWVVSDTLCGGLLVRTVIFFLSYFDYRHFM